ncbi:MAG TPA: AAA family ATPase [Coleofasciculaceae cyanobacterium]|jgi:predicted ATPase/signal transduction histidine kinase/tRNA A-37 threonylcarbamoyl transferase component Bud32
MLTISGYQITEKLYESANSLIYHGQRQVDNQPVVLKMLKQAYPPPEKIAWFKREYEITKSLDLMGVVDAYSLENDHNHWVMVLEDFGGESLKPLMQRRQLSLSEFLSLAIQVADILGQVHQRHVIHKDINPSNIVLNSTTGQLKLIDFGISTVLSQENQTLRNPNVLEGTLAYISPEQTGRMNRAIDYRTDFYSLGATFYELLTGQLPFETTDAMELVHSHIAKLPTPPEQMIRDGALVRTEEIPKAVSDIVMKLMAKNAEDRYQSAYGLKADLEECHRQWQAQGQIDPFTLGRADVSDRFQIPQKLYGREKEVETILAAFERVAVRKVDVNSQSKIQPSLTKGGVEMMLVAGYSGIGKSALVQEVYKPITRQRGYFISGKFDQFQRDIPYASLVQAFRSLILQLLTESEAQIGAWREKLLATLGDNGQVIIDVIPEVELIIGTQPALPELAPAEAQNRFNLVFQNFIKVFTKPEHPLVLFLDDLQWADGASLKLIELLMTTPDSQYLFIIGAYRDNEVSEGHPLMLTLDEIHKVGGIVNSINLGPLDLSNVNQLIADTLKCVPERARPLAELVLVKTNGNPFFINEFLKSLYSENLLTFDVTPLISPLGKEGSKGRWQWNLEQIQAQNITDNVVELMAAKVQKLPRPTQQVLKLAACIGNQFNLQTLAIVCEKSPQQTATELWGAMQEGLILPLSDAYKLIELDVQGLVEAVTVEYKFAHDRIQQAVYSLIPTNSKQAVHWQVGQLLLRNTSPEKREQKLFDIVNQLNQGRGLINQQAQQDELAQLNLMVGKKAKASAAYQPAFNYLQIGLSLLGEDSWERQYNLTLGLYGEAAEAAYLSGDCKQMEQLAKVVRNRAKTVLDTVKVYKVRVLGYSSQHKLPEAMKSGLEILDLLGITLPENPSQSEIIQAIEETKSAWIGKRIEDLIDLPEMTDPEKLAAMDLLFDVIHPAYDGNPGLFTLCALQMVNLSIQYGNTPLSAQGYGSYGIVLCGVVFDIDSGYQFGQLALKLLERFNIKKIKAAVFFLVNYFALHWKEHIRETLKPFLEGYQSGLETGDLLFSAFNAYGYSSFLYWMGKELAGLEREMDKYSDALARINQNLVLSYLNSYWQVILNLMGRSENPCRLIGEAYDEQKRLPMMYDTHDRYGIGDLHLHKFILCYLFEDYHQALENAAIAEKYLDAMIATPSVAAFHFYDSLVRVAVFADTPESEQERILAKVTANQQKMEMWAHHAPMNFLHKFYLVEAERARVAGNDGDAREYYDKAITLAQENEYLNEEALANELAGKFYLARRQNRLAHLYLQDAHYAYQRWGATAKVKGLESRYPQVFAKAETSTLQETLTTSTTTGQSISTALDLTSVLKASQTISGEIVLDKLLGKLMKTVIENAGAQKGFLILDKVGNWVIEAEGVVDSERVTTLQSIPIDLQDGSNQMPFLSSSIINYVARTQENVVLNDAANQGQFTSDPYIVATEPKSILCTPLLNQGKLIGILYLENNLTAGAFTPDRVEVLRLLSSQAAISIENSRLYAQLEDYSRTLEIKVDERTQELREKNQELGATLEKLKATQAQIIAQEKLASLGALTAGIAHEIKNPLNFVNNFAELSAELTEELLEEIDTQKDRLDSEATEYIEEILNDLSQNVKKINEHGKRADNIVRGMLMHSAGKTGERQPTDINALLAEYVNLAYHGMRAKDSSFNVIIKTNYDESIGQVNVVPQNISRVFLNVINNACYSAYEKKMHYQAPANEAEEFSPTLWVSTKNLGDQIEIRIRDNGKGIPEEHKDKIFNPFFTTKPTGQGTGLGLSISHDIIAQEHQGVIKVKTEAGKYAEFTIVLPKGD